MAGIITYQQAVDQMDAALVSLLDAKKARVRSANGREKQMEQVEKLRNDFEYWEKRAGELAPEAKSDITTMRITPF